jgi:hypothetical protein
MLFKEYKRPENVGWKGWIENRKGRALAFVRLDGEIVWNW